MPLRAGALYPIRELLILLLAAEVAGARWLRGQPIRKTCHFFLMETSAAQTSPQRAEGITACQWARSTTR